LDPRKSCFANVSRNEQHAFIGLQPDAVRPLARDLAPSQDSTMNLNVKDDSCWHQDDWGEVNPEVIERDDSQALGQSKTNQSIDLLNDSNSDEGRPS
jgi:hypothetical protein